MYGIRESCQSGMQHELVLVRPANEVDDDIQRVLVNGEMGIVEDDVP